MRLTVAALIAVAAFGATSAPAAACGLFSCFNEALSDDAYPPHAQRLDPQVRELVRAREGMGLSAAGFYNDPAMALSRANYAAPVYAPPPPSYQPADYEPAPEGGPAVIVSPYGRHEHGYGHHAHHRRDAEYLR